uniref:Uncharacterized protein n=1 Tax=Anguilla anguilla TaxID=7936 RepID=A0A0E9WWE2_ANGAN
MEVTVIQMSLLPIPAWYVRGRTSNKCFTNEDYAVCCTFCDPVLNGRSFSSSRCDKAPVPFAFCEEQQNYTWTA